MPSDREIAAFADPQLEQYFLVSTEKLSELIAAAGIRPADDVVEIGAGAGTVARALPESRSLTVVELDKRLIGFLRQNVPHAKVLQGDALKIIQAISFDVLIGNLPHTVTESLLKLMPSLSFRTAVLAVGESTDLNQLGPAFSWSEVTRTTGDDFVPPQPGVSRIVKVVPASRGRLAERSPRLILAGRGERAATVNRDDQSLVPELSHSAADRHPGDTVLPGQFYLTRQPRVRRDPPRLDVPLYIPRDLGSHRYGRIVAYPGRPVIQRHADHARGPLTCINA